MNKIILKHSSVSGKTPTATQIDYGEITLNYNSNHPFLSIKDTDDDIQTISTDEYNDGKYSSKSDTYTKSEVDNLISGITPSSSVTVDAYTKAESDAKFATKEEVPTVPTNVSSFTNDAGYITEHQSLDNYYTKSQTDTKISEAISAITPSSSVTVDAYTKAESDARYIPQGTGNTLGSNSIAIGNDNIASGSTNIVGSNNTGGRSNVIVGNNNTGGSSKSILIGEGLISNSGAKSLTIGTYNDNTESTGSEPMEFCVGVGQNADGRENLMWANENILQVNRLIKAKEGIVIPTGYQLNIGNTKVDESYLGALATQTYVDTKIGVIDTALTNIIGEA